MKEHDDESCTCCGNCQNGAPAPTTSPERRRFLGFLVGAINVGLAGVVFGPVLGFIGGPLGERRKAKWVPVAPLDEIPAGSAKQVKFALEVKDGYHFVQHQYTVFLRRREDGVVCIDPTCTHLGCRVNYQADQHRYFCPCHGGVFDEDGKVVSGPPPKPLDRYETKVENGQVWIKRDV